MPVNAHTHQPFGLLHGGASVTLAETVGSVASILCVDDRQYLCVGQEINANHLRGVSSGTVTATARPFHLGARSHVWHIEIRDESERLVCVSRLTMAIVERRPKSLIRPREVSHVRPHSPDGRRHAAASTSPSSPTPT